MNVLLVEPDAALSRVYRQALELAGYDVATTATAQAAVFAADTVMPDIVVLEMQLVSHGGVEFLYEFRSYSDWRQVPVVVHSLVPPGEFGKNQTMLRSELGVVEYLYKPQTSLAQLIHAVRQAYHAHVPASAG